MASFEELQAALAEARRDREVAAKSVSRSRMDLRRIGIQKDQLGRTVGADSDEWQALLQRERDGHEALKGADHSLAAIGELKGRLIGEFEQFTDPRSQLHNLSDAHPILLAPVRLETRFKTIEQPGVPNRHQLWVRIFPDDWSIDSFDDVLTETEVKKAQHYWTNRWKIGTAAAAALKSFVRDKDRGTWSELMGAFKPGRAHWIREHYQPLNLTDIPKRTAEDEIILAIPTEAPPAQTVQDAIKSYWTAVYIANGNGSAAAAAFDDLKTALGVADEDAKALLEVFAPDGIADLSLPGGTPPPVQTAFVVFPPSDSVVTKLSAWARASRVTTLPERFVLLGFQSDPTTPVLNELGALVPDSLIVGPDPNIDVEAELRAIHGAAFDAFTDDDKAERYLDYLAARSETKWLFDFDEAVRIGMGFKVDLSADQAERGFERLFVIGVKLSSDGKQAQAELEALFAHHQFGESGLAIIPQGTPTNNTETSKSGYAAEADTEDAYDNYHRETAADDPDDPRLKRDGRWLTEILGIDPKISGLSQAPGYDLTDQLEARAMNTALWNATAGYFMTEMTAPVFTAWQRRFTRWFMVHHVSGRGRLPILRIGDQPYGILPAMNFKGVRWPGSDGLDRTLSSYWEGLGPLHQLLEQMRRDWSAAFGSVAYVGRRGEGVDAHKLLLQTIGLHPSSVEYDQRYAESFLQHYNWFAAHGRHDLVEKLGRNYRQRGLNLLTRLGHRHDSIADPEIPVLEKFFLTRENDVNKPPIDDRELSETNGIRAYTDSGQNYIEWLIDNARADHRNIRDQSGFTGNKAPFALLYDLLRHSVNLDFAGTVLDLYREAAVFSEAELSLLRRDSEYVGVRAQPTRPESKWDLLYQSDVRIAPSGETLAHHVSDLVRNNIVNSQTQSLQETLDALELLKKVPTARLERLLAEHLDLCTYRLDAWLMGLLDVRLQAMRLGVGRAAEAPSRGLYLGAFGWVEALRREDRTLSSAPLTAELAAIFDPDATKQPMVDSTNAGYVHAPSVNHALTAAVLRNAYISRANQEAAEPYKINLSSERVRNALAIIEGMQQGQSLGALLGYRLERELHDNTDEELDTYIYELRKLFPLTANKLKETQVKTGRPAPTTADAERNQEEEEALEGSAAVMKLEARNVVDGLALLDHVRKTKKEEYPFGFAIGDGPDQLKAVSLAQGLAINAAVRRLMNVRDAVADLAMAESIHQVVQGNYERAAGALDAYSKGQYPQLPDVIRSPGSGTSLTHRFGIHLPADAASVAGDSVRAVAEPAINSWIKDLLPSDLNQIACIVEHQVPTYDESIVPAVVPETITMAELGLSPADLLYLLNVGTDKGLAALDDYVIRRLFDKHPTLAKDAEVAIKYAQAFDQASGVLSYFELMPMMESLRTLLLSSRPLRASDMAVPNEGHKSQDERTGIEPTPLSNARQAIDDILDELKSDVIDPLNPLVDPEDFDITLGNQVALVAQSDATIDKFIEHFDALSRFGIAEAGFGFVYERRRAIHTGVRSKVADYRLRWRERNDAYRDLIDTEFPAAASDEDKLKVLAEAEKLICASVTVSPTSVPAYLTAVGLKKDAFDNKLDEFDAFLATHPATFKQLLDEFDGLLTDLPEFDPTPLSVENEPRLVLTLVEDMLAQAKALFASKRKKMTEAQKFIDDAAAAAKPSDTAALLTDAAKAIFGDEFIILPRFELGTLQGAELTKSFANKTQLLAHQVGLGTAFPVDDWLYGVARVRDKLAAWEKLVVLAEGVRDRNPIELAPLQLPHADDESWLALAWPPELMISSDKLLYTAYLPSFDATKSQCGLLVDEWTEVVPAKSETTGLTFHFDRPNTEPPQALLLVIPPAVTGRWQFSDVIAAMHETLDLARLRAIEPDHVDRMDYAQFLPATVAATSAWPITMTVNFAMASDKVFATGGGDNG